MSLARPELVALDLEGNGQSQPDIIELALVPVGDAGAMGEAKDWLVRPPRPISAHASLVHGITDKVVSGCPAWADIASDVERALQGKWVVAHHASVDYTILSRHLPQWEPAGLIDTLKLAKAVLRGVSSYSLAELLRHLGLVIPGRLHRARADAVAAVLLFDRLVETGHFESWAHVCAACQVPLATRSRAGPQAAPEQQTLW
jgi:DNA polymerase III epsilon subunit-like protein